MKHTDGIKTTILFYVFLTVTIVANFVLFQVLMIFQYGLIELNGNLFGGMALMWVVCGGFIFVIMQLIFKLNIFIITLAPVLATLFLAIHEPSCNYKLYQKMNPKLCMESRVEWEKGGSHWSYTEERWIGGKYTKVAKYK